MYQPQGTTKQIKLLNWFKIFYSTKFYFMHIINIFLFIVNKEIIYILTKNKIPNLDHLTNNS